MTTEQIRNGFKKFIGDEKYNHFVLTLYEAFPLRGRLFFWQEELLKKFSNEFQIDQIEFENVYNIFNHCPVHNYELKNDDVSIVDGEILPEEFYQKEKNLFPMANFNAPRNLERFRYPKSVAIVYCDKCRKVKRGW
ncbi:hypothetical protein [Aquimarina macrocephali]|uniref:hypothetical protein n=1 Tax=Aquimarina macrocephali TaxID=666563 RepID=UPI003F66E30B